MYFWKVDSLVEDFKNNQVSQKEELKYYLATTILLCLAVDPILYVGSTYNHFDTISSISVLFITICGILYCYKINSNGDNKDFIKRVVCIGFPLLIILLVLIFPLFFLLAFVEALIFDTSTLMSESMDTTLLDTIIYCLFIIIYYFMLSSKIKAVAKNA